MFQYDFRGSTLLIPNHMNLDEFEHRRHAEYSTRGRKRRVSGRDAGARVRRCHCGFARARCRELEDWRPGLWRVFHFILNPFGSTQIFRALLTFGKQSLLFDALGLAPSKDGFWTTSVQPGNPYGDHVTEPTPRLQSAIATLSAGPVAVGDGVNYTNRSLLMRSCRADGRLLQPSRPATPLDCTVLDAALGSDAAIGDSPRGTVWFAPTCDAALGAHRVFGALIVIDMAQAASVVPADLHGLDAAAAYWAVESNWTRAPTLFSAASPLRLPAVHCLLDFQVWSVAPVERVGGWAFLGETDKWAAVTPARFSSVESFGGDAGAGMRVQAMGSAGANADDCVFSYCRTACNSCSAFCDVLVACPGENVNVAFVSPRGIVVRVACTIGESNSVMMGSDGVCL